MLTGLSCLQIEAFQCETATRLLSDLNDRTRTNSAPGSLRDLQLCLASATTRNANWESHSICLSGPSSLPYFMAFRSVLEVHRATMWIKRRLTAAQATRGFPAYVDCLEAARRSEARRTRGSATPPASRHASASSGRSDQGSGREGEAEGEEAARRVSRTPPENLKM